MDLSKVGVFIDRDGTISKEIGYVNHPGRYQLLERAGMAVKELNNYGIKAILATNQAGVARGYFPEEMIKRVHDKLEDLLAKEDAFLDQIYRCIHHPDVGEGKYKKDCNCRKPKPGMLLEGKSELGVDLNNSYMIGDKISDVETGHRVGAKGILVLTGYGEGEYQKRAEWEVEPDYIAEDLFDAVKWILLDLGVEQI